MVVGSGFRILGSGLKVQGSGFRVYGFKVQDDELRVLGYRF
jgi:hypothetical protein